MRPWIKRAVEFAGTAGGLAALARRLTPDGIAVLAYHNVVPPGDAGRGDASLHLPLPRFVEQLELISRTHEVVDLRALPAAGRRPRAVITFDDAYCGAVTLALPELARRGLPATVFVAPALLGADATWWDALAEAGRLDEATRWRSLTEFAGTPLALRELLPEGGPPLPESYRIATPDQLREHCRGGISLGVHGWAHEYLPGLSDARRAEALQRGLAWVRAFSPDACNWLALPYGAGTREIARSALSRGYAGVLLVTGGVWRPAAGRELTPRINVPAGLSTRGLELRTCGRFPNR